MSSSSGMKSMYKYVKPSPPDCATRQFAGTPDEGSVSPDYLHIRYDEWNNVIAEDRTYHANATAEKGSFNFGDEQYSDDWQGGYTAYGVTVEDRGQNPVVERISVDNSRADRGKES